MTYKNKMLTLLVMVFSGVLTAQKLDIKWSDLQSYSNKEDGFFSYYVGGNSKYIYAMFANQTRGIRKQRLKFVAFDSKTMKKVSDATVVDRRNAEEKKKFQGMRYHKTLVFEDILYVFWIKENKERDELYVQTFDAKLKSLNKLKKVYEISSKKKATKKPELFIMGNKLNSQSILIGGELAGEKGESLKIEFKVLKSDFSFAGAGQQTLPAVITSRADFLTSSYEYGDDGNLHVRTRVVIPKDERKSLKKHESYYYTVYSIIDPATNTIKSYPLKFDNKNFFNMNIATQKAGTKIFGFFCDVEKDPRGVDTHGIFFCIVDPVTKEMGKMSFNYFTKAQLDKLFAEDKADQNKHGLFGSKKKKKSEDESLGATYQIEEVFANDEFLTLFCSIMYNYEITTCNSKGQCYTTYYCNKRNVTAFKIDNTGNILWASNLNRSITYTGRWDVKDVSVICPDNSHFYVTYGSAFSDVQGKGKKKTKRKTGKDMRDHLEYAVFDAANGNYKKEEYTINTKETKKKERKYIYADRIETLDNKFYVNSTIVNYKPGWIVGGCVSSLICPPVGYWMIFWNGNAKKGRGNLGIVTTGK
jgi:hypothetical protein